MNMRCHWICFEIRATLLLHFAKRKTPPFPSLPLSSPPLSLSPTSLLCVSGADSGATAPALASVETSGGAGPRLARGEVEDDAVVCRANKGWSWLDGGTSSRAQIRRQRGRIRRP